THCGKCIPACPTGAIRLATAEREKFSILVVDDELIVRDSLRALLADEGFSVDMAESGQEALEKLGAASYDLMLLDIKMPGMDGVEVLKEALAVCPGLQVVMMTAYAAVDTAVETMKEGAVDYLVKPFEPDSLLPQIYRLYEESGDANLREITADAVVVAAGCRYFDPADDKDVFGYGAYADVITHLEFERLISGTGPCGGRLLRPSDGRAAARIAWIQCVGSRDLQSDADYCSSICCMSAVKEATLARRMNSGQVETVIFYMDMRVFEKPFQKYLEDAVDAGVQFERCRVHSVTATDDGSQLAIRYVDSQGAREAMFDLVVLSVGQRPADSADTFSEMLELERNQWGYLCPLSFSLTRTAKPGVFLAGAVAGLTDINESVIRSGAAACQAAKTVFSARAGSAEPVEAVKGKQGGYQEEQKVNVCVCICTCGGRLSELLDLAALSRSLEKDPLVSSIVETDSLCTQEGVKQLAEELAEQPADRILVAACKPQTCGPRPSELGQALGFDQKALCVENIYLPHWFAEKAAAANEQENNTAHARRRLQMALAGLKRADLLPAPEAAVCQSALVIGGGVAGMTAALAIAGQGIHVDLVEQSGDLGGNLKWLSSTIDGSDVSALLESIRSSISGHSLIDLHLSASVSEIRGSAGNFRSIVENGEGELEIVHGAVLVATGGSEAETQSYGHGKSPAVMTHKEFEQAKNSGEVDPQALSAVAMIQCVDCREAPRNYCSRICCVSALKHALYLKEQNPDIAVYVFYRDMMSYGFNEAWFTEARRKGVIFFPYKTEAKPEVNLAEESGKEGGAVRIAATDPVLGQPVEVSADLLLLATGISPVLPGALLEQLGTGVDEHGFFREADFKWRPVESLAAGVYACGLALSPRSIEESIASAEAAAMRAVCLLSRKQVHAGRKVAVVRHALCSRCRLCMMVCPYDARTIDPETGEIMVDIIKCQGCGACAAVCPNSATIMASGSEGEMFEMIDAALDLSC
ncbi:MAG: response regulator, partial [Desulfosalsimonadaceae bacterium]